MGDRRNLLGTSAVLVGLGSALISALMRQFDDAISIAAAVVIVSTVAFIQVWMDGCI